VKILSKLLSGLIPFPSAKPDIVIKEDTGIAGFKIINTPDIRTAASASICPARSSLSVTH